MCDYEVPHYDRERSKAISDRLIQINIEEERRQIEGIARGVNILRGVITENPGPWSYSGLVAQLIEKAGGRKGFGYPARPVDELLNDGTLVRIPNNGWENLQRADTVGLTGLQ